MRHSEGQAEVWIEKILLPTYAMASRIRIPCFWKNAYIRVLPARSIPIPSLTRSWMKRKTKHTPPSGWKTTISALWFFQSLADVFSAPTIKQMDMVSYHKARYASFYDAALADGALKAASAADSLYCFPNKLEDIPTLEYAIGKNPADGRAHYYLGCLYYDRRQYDAARSHWEASAELEPEFPTVWRNLSLAYYNKYNVTLRYLCRICSCLRMI